MGQVLDFVAKPKQLSKQYKRHNYKVTFVPSTKQWSWEVELVQVTKLNGTADTQVKAVRAAERQIDKVLQVQGKEVG